MFVLIKMADFLSYVNVSVNDEEFCFVNIYRPNDQKQQITFYKKMINSIRCR